MRVTENTNYETIRHSIHRSKERMENLQLQSASLKKLNQPSDDPVGASKILELRTDKMNNDQFQMNSKLAESFLSNTEVALEDLTEIIMRAKEIALSQASSASSSDDTRQGVAEEMTQLFNQAVSVANCRVGERYLLGGYKTQKPPVDLEGNYLGDDGQMMVEIAGGVFLSLNIPGNEVFNTNPHLEKSGYGMIFQRGESELGEIENVNLFDELQDCRIGLLTGDLEAIRNSLERFDQLYSKIVATRSKLGSRINGLKSTNQAIERHNMTNAALSSAIEDAEMAQVVSELGKEEAVFRSALASSKKLIQPTLLDFLR